eukprot:NODE_11695_length_1270_cov_7.422572.p1 GENE.NODE_11695_length_1270_cov_7.422572~~NODE_11695_length_1270_cov_7.422572.p1  ORF type:complete len:307 (+),score=95.26 NODE_11695_length_1270_cov_7.422572:64-921(+)
MAVAAHAADVLAAEGMSPNDEATCAELTPSLLESLGIVSSEARKEILALAKSSAASESAKVAAAAPLPAAEGARPSRWGQGAKRSAATEPTGPPVVAKAADDTIEDEVRSFGPFTRRCFRGPGPPAQEVVPGVFLGGCKAADNSQEHVRLGITHVINATRHLRTETDVEVLQLSLRDGDGEQDIASHFPKCITFIDAAIKQGGAVLVHCVRGVSRSATIVAAYVMHRARLSCDEALALVKHARPRAQPRPGFVRQLRTYERLLRHRGARTAATTAAAPPPPVRML